ncbi:hypothetical protein PLESTM_000327800 [Pleodorina starrii]|nr:hypothetical protein PLESTM_000327800 [Pleodorina starrii]
MSNNDALVRGFPFSSCGTRDVALTPYRMSSSVEPLNSTSSKATYCFRIAAVEAADGSSPCASIVINKIELIVSK